MNIAVLGPGRCGTSLLVELFGAFGFVTPQKSENNWYEEARAGLETRIDPTSPFEIQKDPWAFEYLHELSDSDLKAFDGFVIPIRNIEDAVTSRVVLERFSRIMNVGGDAWKYNSWGCVPGCAVSRTDYEGVASTLSQGLWRVLSRLSEAGIQPIFLHYPRFSTDFEYLWEQIGHICETRTTKALAQTWWASICDPTTKTRVLDQDNSISTREYQLLINRLSTTINSLQENIKQLNQQQQENLVTRETLHCQLESERIKTQELITSRTWRWTSPIRRLITMVGR